MLYLDEDFVAAVRGLTIKRVASGSGISERTLTDVIACTDPRREGHEKHAVGKAEHIERICDFVNRQLGTTFEVGNVVKTSRSRFMGHAGVNVFVGGKDLDMAGTRYPGLTDVWVLFEMLSLIQKHPVDLVLELAVPPALEEALAKWKKSQGSRLNVVLGSALVNGAFEPAYVEISRHFDQDAPHTLEFIFHPPEANTVSAHLLADYAARQQHFARVRRDRGEAPGVRTDGVDEASSGRFRRTWAQTPGQEYQDISVVMASRRNLVLAGHGSAGTFAAVALFKERRHEVERAILDNRAIILVSRVAVAARTGFQRPLTTLKKDDMLCVVSPPVRSTMRRSGRRQ